MSIKCSSCAKAQTFFTVATDFVNVHGRDFCKPCGEQFVNEVTAKIMITTTNSFDGYSIARYIDIESVEIVIGTGIFTEWGGGLADFFGQRSTGFERKLQQAKQTAFKKLKYLAFEKGGNAVVGVDIDYTEFSGNRIGLIANGTLVAIEKE